MSFQKNTQDPWVKEVHKDEENNEIKEERTGNRNVFRRLKIAEAKDLPDNKQTEHKGYSQKKNKQEKAGE